MNWDILSRFRKGEPSTEEAPSIEQISGCAKRCLGNKEGDILLKHLVEEFDMDAQKGCLTPEESVYVDGKQDALKYILVLLLD